MKIAQEGYPFIIFFIVVTVLVFLFFDKWFAIFPFILLCFMIFFFRDPERITPDGENLYIAPADGRVILIQNTFEERFLHNDAIQISIFMSPLNVHVNRSPCRGKVKDVVYSKGKFFSAFKPEASLYNESISLLLETVDGVLLIRQIAGSIARRAVCRVKKGDLLQKGERFGIIKFSSRVDIFLPKDSKVLVKMGQKVRAGETIIAEKS